LVRNEGDPLRAALVCPPAREYTRVEDTVRHNFVEVPDAAAAADQHAELRRVLARAGANVVEVPELAGHPNSVFVRDVALATPRGFVRLRMGLMAREGEELWLSEHLQELGFPEVGAIDAPGTLEGGDVFLLGDLALVGLSARANLDGAGQLARLLSPMGYHVRCTPIPPPALHLGSVLSPVGPRRVVSVEGALPGEFLHGVDVIRAPRERPDTTANVLCLRENVVLADAQGSPGTLDALREAGVTVHALDLSEFGKGSGGPTCLVLPLGRG
jgi:dimethylargininase